VSTTPVPELRRRIVVAVAATSFLPNAGPAHARPTRASADSTAFVINSPAIDDASLRAQRTTYNVQVAIDQHLCKRALLCISFRLR